MAEQCGGKRREGGRAGRQGREAGSSEGRAAGGVEQGGGRVGGGARGGARQHLTHAIPNERVMCISDCVCRRGDALTSSGACFAVVAPSKKL